MLLPARRPALLAAAVVAVAVVITLGILFAGQGDPTRLDQWVLDNVQEHVPEGVLDVLLVVTEPVLLIAVLAVVVLLAVRARRFDLAVLAVVGPAVAVTLSSLVLKPLVGRRYYGTDLAYPSGHTTVLTATILVVVIAVAMLGRPAWTTAAAVVGLVVLVAGIIGLVGLEFHYVTDTFGGICVAGATIAVVSSVLDSSGIRRTHGDQQRRGVHPMK